MRLIRQALQTPDGTIIESRHRHDYIEYTDKVANDIYVIDGGLEYERQSVNKIPAKSLSVYLEDGIEAVREALTWGTRGRSGREPVRLIKLCEMSNAHIEACLETQPRMHPHYREAMQMELQYRSENGLTITDD